MGVKELTDNRGEGCGGSLAREFAEAFYKSDAWRQCRNNYAKSVGWLCEDCLSLGVYNPGKIVHHIIHLTPENISNPSITLDWNNLRLVCRDCHAREHKTAITKRYYFDEHGNVCPPYQGKTEGTK